MLCALMITLGCFNFFFSLFIDKFVEWCWLREIWYQPKYNNFHFVPFKKCRPWVFQTVCYKIFKGYNFYFSLTHSSSIYHTWLNQRWYLDFHKMFHLGAATFFFSHFISFFFLFCFCPDFQKLDALELSGFPTLRRIGKQMMAGGGGWGKSCVLSGRKSSYLVFKTEPCWGRKATWRGQGTQLPCMVQTPMAHASFSISYLATAMSHLLRYVPIDGIEKMAA